MLLLVKQGELNYFGHGQSSIKIQSRAAAGERPCKFELSAATFHLRKPRPNPAPTPPKWASAKMRVPERARHGGWVGVSFGVCISGCFSGLLWARLWAIPQEFKNQISLVWKSMF